MPGEDCSSEITAVEKSSGERGHPSLGLNLTGKALSFLPFSIRSAVGGECC